MSGSNRRRTRARAASGPPEPPGSALPDSEPTAPEWTDPGPPRLRAAGVSREEDRPDQGLDGVGQDRPAVPAAGRLLTAPQPDGRPDTQVPADGGQRTGVDDGGTQPRQRPLPDVGESSVEPLGDDHPEHGVPEELQPLVGRQPAVLVGVGAVRERQLEQLAGDRDGQCGRQGADRAGLGTIGAVGGPTTGPGRAGRAPGRRPRGQGRLRGRRRRGCCSAARPGSRRRRTRRSRGGTPTR